MQMKARHRRVAKPVIFIPKAMCIASNFIHELAVPAAGPPPFSRFRVFLFNISRNPHQLCDCRRAIVHGQGTTKSIPDLPFHPRLSKPSNCTVNPLFDTQTMREFLDRARTGISRAKSTGWHLIPDIHITLYHLLPK